MKTLPAIVVFFSLIIPSFFFGYTNYATAKYNIIKDLNQALAKTVLHEKPDIVTADTLRIFKSNLQIDQLKNTSYLSLCSDEPSRIAICSDTVSFKVENERLFIRAYPNCSKATIFSISEQTLPSVLFALSLLWGIFSIIYLHRKKKTVLNGSTDCRNVVFGNLFFSVSSEQFYDEQKEPIYFTPMQLSLMQMLMKSENKRLPVDEICHNLWPGKDNAKETLYTLIRRLKPVVERHTNVKIVAHKNGYYGLSCKIDD